MISGLMFLFKSKRSGLRSFVWFIVFTVLFELVQLYTYVLDDWAFLKFLKDTKFARNFWLSNLYIMISLIFYISFFRYRLKLSQHKQFLKYWLWLSLVAVILSLSFLNQPFFASLNNGIFFWTSASVFLCCSLYFYELLSSDKVLEFYRIPMFYISAGLFVWWLVFPPLAVYYPFYLETHPSLVSLHQNTLLILNIFLYSMYTLAFAYATKFNQ